MINNNSRDQAPTKDLRIMVILSALMSFASVSTDLYLPAMPMMGVDLHGDANSIELTISGFLIGFSLGQLVWGPLSDRHGRRRPVIAGIVLFIIGSVGCAMSDTVWQMIGWRVVQAVGASVGPVLARAMVRDLYPREQGARMLSTLILIMGIAPLIGPLLGGQILLASSWHGIFWALAIVGCLALVALRYLPETLAESNRVTTPLHHAFADYWSLVRDPRMIGYALSGGFFYGGAYAYVAGTPFAYIDYYHVSPQAYGLLFGANIIGIMGANFLNGRLINRMSSEQLFRMGAWIVAASSVVMGFDAWFGWGGLAGLAIPVFFYMSMNGFIVANSVAGALSTFPHKAGAASALLGALHYGSGIFTAAMLSWFADGTPRTLGSIIGICGVACLVSSLAVPRQRSLAAAHA